jgi:hypothetical protein
LSLPSAIGDNTSESHPSAGDVPVIFGGEWPGILSAIWHDVRKPPEARASPGLGGLACVGCSYAVTHRDWRAMVVLDIR